MANAKLGAKAVGSIVKLKVGGTAKEFIVVHQGKPSSMYDSSCDGTWLLMKDILEATRWHSSDDNNLENSTIRRPALIYGSTAAICIYLFKCSDGTV